MKLIELRRHSKKIGPGNVDLSPEGVALAEEVGVTLRGKKFNRFFVSSLKRTSETLEAFRRAAGDFPNVEAEIFSPHLVGETEDAMLLWTGVCNAAEHRGGDMLEAALVEDTERALRFARNSAESFRIWLAELPEDTHALVIGHSPSLELMAYGLFQQKINVLQPCEGFIISQDDGRLSLKIL